MERLLSLGKDRTVTVTEKRIVIRNGDWILFDLPVCTGADMTGKEPDRDGTARFKGSFEKDGAVNFSWEGKSSDWRKEYTFSVFKDHAEYAVRIYGSGPLEKVRYFCAEEGAPGANYDTDYYALPVFENIDGMTARRLCGEDYTLEPYLACPPPHVFPFSDPVNRDWLGVGVAAEKGKCTYDRFSVRFDKPRTFWFEIPYAGCTSVCGEMDLPTLYIGFGGDPFEVVGNYCAWTREKFSWPQYCPAAVPAWWRRPIFCGWVEQWFRDGQTGKNIQSRCTEEEYTRMISRMENAGMDPGTVIIDDKWQSAYGTWEVDTAKWPDLKGFISSQHERGRRVLLWVRLWAPEGLDEDECIRKDGEILSADPTSPKYQKRLGHIIPELLNGYGADGFKIDYLYRMPPIDPADVMADKKIRGMELYRLYFETVYRLSKAAKPDCMINTSIAHPYFSDVCDVIRLHDYCAAHRASVSIMKYRASVARAVFPGILIDTDGGNSETLLSQTVILHNREACKIGIPSLYALEPFSDGDLAVMQRDWDSYERALK